MLLIAFEEGNGPTYLTGFTGRGVPEFEQAPSEGATYDNEGRVLEDFIKAMSEGPEGTYSIVANAWTSAEEVLHEEHKVDKP